MADDFSQFILGGTSNPSSSSNVGNIRPVGSSTGFQQYATPEEGIKAVDDQLRIYGTKHKINTLRGVISRWAPPSENDTEAYIKNVSQKTGLNPDEEIDLTNPTIRHIISGPIILQEKGLKTIKGTPVATQPQETAPQQPTDDFNSFLAGSTSKETQPSQQTQTIAKPTGFDFAKPKAMVDPNARATAVVDTFNPLGILPAVSSTMAYGVGRIAGKSPEEATKFSEKATKELGFDVFQNMAGKATNQLDKADYQHSQLGDFIAENYDKGAEWISKQTGAPKEDIQKIIETGLLAYGGKSLISRKPSIKPTTEGVTTVSPITEAPPIGPKYDVPTYLRNKFEEKQGKPTGQPQGQPTSQPSTQPLGSAKAYDPSKEFSEVHYSESILPAEEQQARAETLHRIDPNLKVDPNILEGRGKERATDYQLSKTDTPEGNVLSEKEKEYKASLNRYGEKLIEDTGGTLGLDETAKYRRGENTLDYFQKLEDHFDKKLTEIYSERDRIAKDIPVNGENINKSLNDESLTSLNSDSEGLAKSAKAKLKSLHMMDDQGNMLPSNGMQAEKFRQWLNEKNVWDRKNAGLHRALKDAVDADVISTLDPSTSIYKDARDLFGLKKDTLENPKGISKILDAEGPNGINRKIDIEGIPDSITKMGVDQFTHILDTIKNAPPELQEAANNSLAQIKSHFLNQAHEAFQASANKGTAYLKANREVMTRLFSPEEMSKIHDYNTGAHILKADTGYPGAKVQEVNINKRLPRRVGEQMLKKGAAMTAEILTGGKTFGNASAIAHEYVGGKIAKGEAKTLEKIHKENADKKRAGFTNLQDIMNKGKKD
ncbi:hypothetical protein UFOVP96_14 [uncultured Caudovirales phage]|uniref:Uncharacterized protein n=1 Tax=uncultured Caudovirales phage TaxID=2100421 RepID=A0A6J5L0B7_9CAUD|nr:hypothetical protein UFOVP96_14 [uncultured Caudovirales phage]